MTEQLLTKQSNSDVGLGLFIDEKGINKEILFGHGGWDEGFVGNITFYRDYGKGMAILCNTDFGSRELIDEVRNSAARIYSWPSYLKDFTIQPKETFSKQIYGRYKIDTDYIIEIYEKDSQVFLKADVQDPIQIFNSNDGTYFAKGINVEIKIEEKEDGEYEILLLQNRKKFPMERITE
jgi:hypothetical protein